MEVFDWALGLATVLIVAVFSHQARSAKRRRVEEAESRRAWLETEKRAVAPASLHPKVNLDACIGSRACIEACPEDFVLGLVEGRARLVNPSSCIGHGECLRACPVNAIQLVLGSEKRPVDIPITDANFETNVPGLYIVGELGGMGLIYNAMKQGLSCLASIVRAPPAPVEGAHQLLIVGAGPAGIAASLAAKEAGLDFRTIDQEARGGTVLHYPRNKLVMTRSVRLPIHGDFKVEHISKEDLLERWEAIVVGAGLEVENGRVATDIQRREDGTFEVATSMGPIRASRVVLAIGRRGSPRKLGAPGEESAKVTYRLLDPENFAGARCLVVGGGDSAIEAALSLARAGAKAHLVHRGDAFDRARPKNVEALEEARTSGQVEVLLSAKILEVRPDAVTVETPAGRAEILNDQVFVLIGGTLPIALLKSAGVTIRAMKGEVHPAHAVQEAR